MCGGCARAPLEAECEKIQYEISKTEAVLGMLTNPLSGRKSCMESLTTKAYHLSDNSNGSHTCGFQDVRVFVRTARTPYEGSSSLTQVWKDNQRTSRLGVETTTVKLFSEFNHISQRISMLNPPRRISSEVEALET